MSLQEYRANESIWEQSLGPFLGIQLSFSSDTTAPQGSRPDDGVKMKRKKEKEKIWSLSYLLPSMTWCKQQLAF